MENDMFPYINNTNEDVSAFHKKIMEAIENNGVFDDDLYQEQCMIFVHCIEIFEVKWAERNHYNRSKCEELSLWYQIQTISVMCKKTLRWLAEKHKEMFVGARES